MKTKDLPQQFQDKVLTNHCSLITKNQFNQLFKNLKSTLHLRFCLDTDIHQKISDRVKRGLIRESTKIPRVTSEISGCFQHHASLRGRRPIMCYLMSCQSSLFQFQITALQHAQEGGEYLCKAPHEICSLFI